MYIGLNFNVFQKLRRRPFNLRELQMSLNFLCSHLLIFWRQTIQILIFRFIANPNAMSKYFKGWWLGRPGVFQKNPGHLKIFPGH